MTRLWRLEPWSLHRSRRGRRACLESCACMISALLRRRWHIYIRPLYEHVGLLEEQIECEITHCVDHTDSHQSDTPLTRDPTLCLSFAPLRGSRVPPREDGEEVHMSAMSVCEPHAYSPQCLRVDHAAPPRVPVRLRGACAYHVIYLERCYRSIPT